MAFPLTLQSQPVKLSVSCIGGNLEKKGFHLAHEASLVVSDEFTGLHGREEYTAAVAHVSDLIRTSYTLFVNGSFAPSLFLTLTVFEEIAKIKAGHARSWGKVAKR